MKVLERTDFASSLATPLPPDLPNDGGPDILTAVKPKAAAADISVTAIAIRSCERR